MIDTCYNTNDSCGIIVTAGSRYLDIDAYACCVALRELLELKGKRAVAFSKAKHNYSVCGSLIKDDQMKHCLPPDYSVETSKYIICDVSDPDYIKDGAPLDNVVEIFDHHTGFEKFWHERIGDNAHIEFIGAAATLICQEWVKAGLLDKMTRSTALLLIAAILDNTLYLTSSIVTDADREAFDVLCRKANVGEAWCAAYFSEVQDCIEDDLHNALFNDLKIIRNHPVIPTLFGQLCIWDSQRIVDRLDEIRRWFENKEDSWMLNIIDIKRRCSCFVCSDTPHRIRLEDVFKVRFDRDIATTQKSYLRKEIIKITDSYVRQIRD